MYIISVHSIVCTSAGDIIKAHHYLQVHALQQRVSQLEPQNESLSSELRAAEDKITSHSLLHQEALSSLNYRLAKVRVVNIIMHCMVTLSV